MATDDLHRMLDNKLPEGKHCEAVSMYLVYTAKINGEDVTVSVEPGTMEEDVAAKIVAEVGSTKNAQVEGAEAPEDDVVYDDSDDDDDDAADEDIAAVKSQPKSKKKK